MATSFKLVVATVAEKKSKKAIATLPTISRGVEKGIFTAVYLAALCLAAAKVPEEVLVWTLASLWLFLATALIYTPELIRLQLIVWVSLGGHLALQTAHSAAKGSSPYVTAITAFVNSFAVLLESAPLALIGLVMGITQSALKEASVYHHISLVFLILPVFHIVYGAVKKYRSK